MWVFTSNLVLHITKIINIYTLVTHSFQIHIWFHIENVGVYIKLSVANDQDNQHLDIGYKFISYSYSKCGCVHKIWYCL